jgi:hypothetical protein
MADFLSQMNENIVIIPFKTRLRSWLAQWNKISISELYKLLYFKTRRGCPFLQGILLTNVCLIVYSRTSNFSAFWRLSPSPVIGLQISTYDQHLWLLAVKVLLRVTPTATWDLCF